MALDRQSPTTLRFGVFEVDLRARELRKQGKRIRLQDQPFQVLSALLQHPGDVVTREELRSQIWPQDTFVDFDNSLNTAINKLREALGDSADNPRFIETLPRRGYRFLVPICGDRLEKFPIPATRWKTAAAAAVVVLTAGSVAGGLLWHSQQARRMTDKDTIVLADFANTTGDPVFDNTLKQGLRVQLEQSPFLKVLSDQKVGEELRLMGHAKDERLTQAVAREVCQRSGSKAFLTGSISNLGAHYVLGLNALNCETGDALGSSQVEAERKERVLKALSDAAIQLREKLGESLSTIQKYDAPMEATTSSLEALQAYTLAIRAFYSNGDAAAIPFFQRAVKLDPNFAMAYAHLGNAYGNLGVLTPAEQNIRKAYEMREKVSQRERLYIEAHYYDTVSGELEKAAEVYGLYFQIYSGETLPYNNLAAIDGTLGNYEKAVTEGRKALALGPDFEDNYATLGQIYISLNRMDELEALLRQAAEHKLESDTLFWCQYQLAFLKNDAGEMDRLVQSAGGKQGPPDLVNLQAQREAQRGRIHNARDLWRRAINSAEASGAADRAAIYENTAALVEAYLGNSHQARIDVEAGQRQAVNRDGETAAALALAIASEVKEAEKLRADLSNRWPLDIGVQRYSLPAIDSALALHRRDSRKAIELLGVVGSYETSPLGQMDPVYLRGRAYLLQGDARSAVVQFEKVIAHPGLVLENPVGALVHIDLGRAYALQGDTAKARIAYQDFLTLWKDADPDIPILKQAKTEYAKLN